jgi:hypothetical protein
MNDLISMSDFSWKAGFQTWCSVVLCTAAIGFILSSLIAGLSRRSLIDGFVATGRGAIDFFRDLASLSPRRIGALAWHSVLESIRRRMLLAVFGVLAVIFMFGGWFLDARPTEQVRVYVGFVLLSSTLIAIPAGGLLACLSLPSDIRDKTIHTVVTKPVRRLEIILGRVLGMTFVATVFLAVSGLVSYVYMWRSVGGSLAELQQKLAEAKQSGDVRREAELKDGIEQIQSKLIARVPVFGAAFGFSGKPKNVGNESMKRGYIEGNSPDTAIWVFDRVPVDRILQRQSIPLEMTFTVFRTTKGEIGRGVLAQLTYTNRETGRQITDYPFEVREYYVNQQALDNKPEGKDYVDEGRRLQAPPQNPLQWLLQGGSSLQVEVRCLSPSQYVGMARDDLYILLDNANFGVNFAKGMVGVWLRVFLIICVAVMFSTVLSSYVAMLATAAVFVGGWRMPYLRTLAEGRSEGGGPLEAAIRLVTHENLQRPLDKTIWTDMVRGGDVGWRGLLQAITHVLPDLGVFNTGGMVADGFNISASHLLANIVFALAYAIPVMITAYYLLRSREIAR